VGNPLQCRGLKIWIPAPVRDKFRRNDIIIFTVFSVAKNQILRCAQNGVWEIRVKEAYSIFKTTTDFAGNVVVKTLPLSLKSLNSTG